MLTTMLNIKTKIVFSIISPRLDIRVTLWVVLYMGGIAQGPEHTFSRGGTQLGFYSKEEFISFILFLPSQVEDVLCSSEGI